MNENKFLKFLVIPLLFVLGACKTSTLTDSVETQNLKLIDESKIIQLDRRIVSRDVTQVIKDVPKNGQIVTYVCIDRHGDVISAAIDDSLSSVQKPKFEKSVLAMVKNYKYEPNPSAPEKECGHIKLSFKRPK